MNHPIARERSLAPDLARGLMLLLIVLSNTVFHLWAAPYGPSGWHPADGSGLDRAVQFAMITTLDLRVYPLFAFLFGYGLWVSFRRRVDEGVGEATAAARVRRRCLWLVVFGAVHAGLLMAGDVLASYGVLGLLVGWLLLRRSDRTIVVVCGFATVILVALLVFGGLLYGLDLLDGGAGPVPPAPSSADAYATGQASWLASVLPRLGTWGVVTASVALSVTAPLALLLGVLAARRGILADPGAHLGLLRVVAVAGIGVGWLGGVPAALAHVGAWSVPDAVLADGGPLFVAQWATGPAAGLGYVAAFALLAHRVAGRAHGTALTAVRAMGRRSMSTYLSHSLLCAPLLAAWGFGLGAHLSSASMALVAVAAWLVTAVLALGFERAGRRGPAEALLGRLVDGRRQRAGSTTAVTTSPSRTAQRPVNDVSVTPSTAGPSTRSDAVNVPSTAGTSSASSKPSQRPASGNQAL